MTSISSAIDVEDRSRSAVLNVQLYKGTNTISRARRHMPFLGAPLIIGLDGSAVRIDSDDGPTRPRVHNAFLVGLQERFVTSELPAGFIGIQINLAPLGAHKVFGMPMDALTNRAVDLEDIVGAEGRHLVERLDQCPTWSGRLAILGGFLNAQIAINASPSPGVLWAFNQVVASNGQLAVASLARQLGWSHRRLIAEFRRQVGLSPKRVAGILRFGRAASLLARSEARIADVAVAANYYDESHLINDFRRFAGVTPARFRARRLSDGHVAAPPSGEQ